jgi:phospholipase A1
LRHGGKEALHGRAHRAARATALALVLAVPAPGLHAQTGMDLPEGPARGAAAEAARCRLIAADAERLACFDRLFPPSVQPGGATAPEGESRPAGAQPTPNLQEMRPAQATPPPEERDLRRSLGTTLADRWELDSEHDRGRFLFRPYKPMYVLVADWSSNRNQRPTSPNPANTFDGIVPLDSVEAKYQLSFKTKAAKSLIAGHGDLWLGYTQTSHWQVYNSNLSRPFRETMYEPEIMTVFSTDYSVLGWRGRMMGLNLNHQSNGRSEPFSRSWNRVIAHFGFERDNWMMTIRPWWRIPESAATDDNPDIEDYLGRADLLLVRKSEGHETTLMLRHSLRTGSRSHGAVEIGHAFPIASYLKGYIQVFSGYGASMIDYNHRQTRIGVGISLVQWL